VIGWQLAASAIADVYEGICTIAKAAYGSDLKTVDLSVSPPIFALLFSKPGSQPVNVADNDWFVFDGRNAWDIPQAMVAADYTVTQQS
jgi:hypothetical protein